jgi:hypothetical protein
MVVAGWKLDAGEFRSMVLRRRGDSQPGEVTGRPGLERLSKLILSAVELRQLKSES